MGNEGIMNNSLKTKPVNEYIYEFIHHKEEDNYILCWRTGTAEAIKSYKPNSGGQILQVLLHFGTLLPLKQVRKPFTHECALRVDGD